MKEYPTGWKRRAAGFTAREMKRRALASGAVLLLSACGSTPLYGPGVLVLPGSGKSFDQFRSDEHDCRGYAQAQLNDQEEDSAGPLQRRYDRAFLQCMYAKGHKIPVGSRYSDSTESVQSAGVTARPPPPPSGQPPAEAPPDYRAK
ncbi:MAG TPA: glycine zipper family protein [Burkholderiales bacterium]|nr:glycine zipper family protein [Burkholderiales bacterium]